MKYIPHVIHRTGNVSPSMRREWIEILHVHSKVLQNASPSMRREWIEMKHLHLPTAQKLVSLHAEGVD